MGTTGFIFLWLAQELLEGCFLGTDGQYSDDVTDEHAAS